MPATRMDDMLSQLTTVLLQAPYAFLQRFQQAGGSEVDIFDSQHSLLVRIEFSQGEPQAAVALTTLPSSPTALTPDAATLVQTLTRLWAPTAVEVP